MIKKVLLEAKTIDDEYNKDWSDISREVFDKIIVLDPQTDIEKNKIGSGTKQLLLPKYVEGETDFVDNKDVTTALDTFYKNRGTYPQTLRNLGNFPSVKDFVDYIINGDESEFAKTHDFDTVEQPKEKESKLDALYKQYYEKNIDRETFNQIIELDPQSSENSIGPVAKNLLLPKYIAGEKFLDDLRIEKAIAIYYADSDTYPADKKELTKYNSVKEFVDYVTAGPESSFIADLKSHYKEGKDFEVIGSTKEYDIIQPLCWKANTRIVGKENPTDDSGSAKLKWCTGYASSSTYWDDYIRHGPIVDFIFKADPKNRQKCYQLNLNKSSSTVYAFLDGNDNNNSGKNYEGFFEQFLAANLDVALAICNNPIFVNNPSIKKVIGRYEAANKPIDINSLLDIKTKIDNLEIKDFVKELHINMEAIPFSAFSNYTALKTIKLEGVKRIGVESFFNCISLERLEFPEGLEEIGAEAFAGCVSLRGQTRVPDSLTKIGRSAFRDSGKNFGLSINRARKTKLQVSPEDASWLASHAKLITVQENLQEEIIDENIPRDLARAYQNSNAATNGIQSHPNSRHNELQRSVYNRRNVRYDYYNSTYEELSKDQAIEYLGLDVRDTDVRDENGKIAAKARTTNRELFNSRICDLRFIIDNKVVEYEVRGNNNALYLAYWLEIPERYFGDYPEFRGKDGDTTDVRFANKYSDIYTIIQIADKIYKTDEYEHEITDTTPTGKKVKVLKTGPDGKPLRDEEGNIIYDYDIIDDTIQQKRERGKEVHKFRSEIPTEIQDAEGNWVPNPEHQTHAADYNFGGSEDRYSHSPNTKYGISIPDTGAHLSKDIYRVLNNVKSFDATEYYQYCSAVEEKKKLFKKYNYLRQALQKLEKEQELYDEAEFNDLRDSLIEKKAAAYKAYQDICLDVRKLKDKLILVFDNITSEINNNIKTFLRKIQAFKNQEYDVFRRHGELKGKDIYQTSSRLRQIKQEIASIDNDIQIYNKRKDEILNKITELQNQLQNQDVSIERAVAQSAELLQQADKLSNEEIQSKFNRLDALEREMAEIQAEIDAMSPKQAQLRKAKADKNKTKEIGSDLASVLDFGTETTDTEGGDSTTSA